MAEARVTASGSHTGNPIRDSALGRVPQTLEDIVALNGQVWHDSLVSPTLLEIIRLRNARTVNCVFCQSVRYEVARQDGLTEARAQMVDGNYYDSQLSAREKLAVALADAYLGYPAGASAPLTAALRQEFSGAQIASMLVALMSFNLTSRTAVSIGGMPEEPLPLTLLPVSSTTP
ncbi:MAG TPA: carboxymuconolactone decarboxylase family protein [Steroidobacteraceae bacterium]|jgi:alkylhydroperoxidase family enzyme|nr:carboxymuconolactone decarboxylase family protein [Steroidobacteraceae bacterium]